MTFYDRLDVLLNEQKMTYSSLSKKLGVSRFMISQSKSRNSELSDKLMQKIAEIFVVSESWLRWGYTEETWDLDIDGNDVTPEGIVYRLETVISYITKNYDKNSEDFYKIIQDVISKAEINSIKLRRKNIDLPRFIEIAKKLEQNPMFLLFGKEEKARIDPWLISIAEKNENLLKLFVCLNDENKHMVLQTASNAFFAEKYIVEQKDVEK
jgi:transcriptional regulator with XRE-family HTH domain